MSHGRNKESVAKFTRGLRRKIVGLIVQIPICSRASNVSTTHQPSMFKRSSR
jgi:hypothetical protein